MILRIGERDIEVSRKSVSVGLWMTLQNFKNYPFKLQVLVNHMAKKCMGKCNCRCGGCNIAFYMEHSRFEAVA